MEKQELQNRFDELAEILVKDMNPQGFWSGELSSSALGVAVAIAAFHFYDAEQFKLEIAKGFEWLKNNINADGSFGDSPQSPGNVSTSLLVYAATNLYSTSKADVALLQSKVGQYLLTEGIDTKSSQVGDYILEHYRKDYTFSVPILTMCGLCGVPDERAFDRVPQLPFEMALLPRGLYRFLNLSVVSYAIPALIAVGIVIFKKKKSSAFGRFVRNRSVRKSLELLDRLAPASGGFLEAIPLTAFVCLSLIEAGYGDLEVVRNGIGFLKQTQRDDGSWPIDVDLSTWVTGLSVRALRNQKDKVLALEVQDQIANHLLRIQNKQVHPFNGSLPGGWGWTNHSGAVPDGDDTPGAILTLLKLKPIGEIQAPVVAGCDWLVGLQNHDGGFPTFSRGWGKLPFDQSCADLTGHALLALSATIEAVGDGLNRKQSKEFCASISGAIKYLEKNQQANGSWTPLWFGNQLTSDHSNPVYGTARVLTYLGDANNHQWINSSLKSRISELISRGEQFLVHARNEDGSWGGDKGVVGTMEETALAVAALTGSEHQKACDDGLMWLNLSFKRNGLRPSPIGLYFASLWYDEKLYPLSFYLEALSRAIEN
jgi:squalene-hopene/tetraprenyl-beta-curcumene cyclase